MYIAQRSWRGSPRPAHRLVRRVGARAVPAGAAVLLLAGASSALAQGPPRATAVDPEIVNGSAQQQLDAARGRWKAAHVGDYHFTVERQCFCVPASRGPVTIVVRDGVPLAPPAPFEDVAAVRGCTP